MIVPSPKSTPEVRISVVIGPDRKQAAGTYYVFSARRAKRKERKRYFQDREGNLDE